MQIFIKYVSLQVGLEQYEAGNYEVALGIFEKAMDLPGTGIKQFRQAARPC